MPFARERPRIDQLLRIDAGGRSAGDIADVVGAGAARAQPQILHRLDHGDRIVRFDFADLNVGARRDVRVAAAVTLGEVGKTGELRRLEDAVRDPQSAHIRVLVRRDVKQTEKTPAEIVRRLWIFALFSVLLQPLVRVEWMLLALEFFLIGKFAAGAKPAGSAPSVRPRPAQRVRLPQRRLRRRRSTGDALGRLGNLHAGDEPFQVAFLFGVEVAGLCRGRLLEVSLAHSAGTRVGAASGAGAAVRGLWVM